MDHGKDTPTNNAKADYYFYWKIYLLITFFDSVRSMPCYYELKGENYA